MKTAIILATGFEEIEAIAPLDILRRGGVDASLVGLDASEVVGAHGVSIKTDSTLKSYDFSTCDMIILPGGLPGAEHLSQSSELRELLLAQANSGKYCAAICAAPMALAKAGLIKGAYTCYPGFESKVSTSAPSKEKVVIEGKIITSRGPGTAYDFGLALLELLAGRAKSDEVAKGMLLA